MGGSIAMVGGGGLDLYSENVISIPFSCIVFATSDHAAQDDQHHSQ